jgi:hypothetical protein
MSERIDLNDTFLESIMKMSDGNPGALTVLMEIFKYSGAIDPNDYMPGFGPILSLDTYGIYGSSIWVLYNDVCDRDIVKTIAVLRAAQLGFLDINTLKRACDENNYQEKTVIPIDELLQKVKERLPKFGNLPDEIN